MKMKTALIRLLVLPSALMTVACSSQPIKTVEKVDLKKFEGPWYVLAGRFTSFEKEVHNGIESYKLNPDADNIEISFNYNKGSFTGEKKSIPQTGWVVNKETNAHWKVRPWWPLKFDYLIVALADDYSWTAIGVPSQKYLWIMARDWENPEPTIEAAVKKLNEVGYDSTIDVRVPHQH
jgi:apolipoprotein D and lipocalin family protein